MIDYYSRYLLACHLTFSYNASQAMHSLNLAREEAERGGRPLAKRPFLQPDNGPSFTAPWFVEFIREPYSQVRIQYRTPQQLRLLATAFLDRLVDGAVILKLTGSSYRAHRARPVIEADPAN